MQQPDDTVSAKLTEADPPPPSPPPPGRLLKRLGYRKRLLSREND